MAADGAGDDGIEDDNDNDNDEVNEECWMSLSLPSFSLRLSANTAIPISTMVVT